MKIEIRAVCTNILNAFSFKTLIIDDYYVPFKSKAWHNYSNQILTRTLRDLQAVGTLRLTNSCITSSVCQNFMETSNNLVIQVTDLLAGVPWHFGNN